MSKMKSVEIRANDWVEEMKVKKSGGPFPVTLSVPTEFQTALGGPKIRLKKNGTFQAFTPDKIKQRKPKRSLRAAQV